MEAKQMTSMQDAALEYTRQGFRIFPCHTVDKTGLCSCGNPDCKSPGKHPLTPNGLNDATTDELIVAGWWKRWPWANIGLCTGDGLMVIDIDVGEDKAGDEEFAKLEEEHGDLPRTVESITGSGGRHIFLRYDHSLYKVKSGTNVLGPGIDIRADGGYVIVPPSKHISGQSYEWNVDNE